MKKILLSAAVFCAAVLSVNAQDKMKKHSGESIDVKVIRVGDATIIYKYPGEESEQTIGRLAVANITYGSGRKEEISEKIVIAGKDDWEKVQILTEKEQAMGLKKGEEVRGKTSGFISYNSAGSADKKATKRIKEAAAELMAPFVLMASEKTDNFGVKQSIKNGVAYSYK